MAWNTITANPFTVPGSAAGFLDIRRKNTTGPVVTVAVPAYTPTTTPVAVEIRPAVANYWYGAGIERISGSSTLSAALANLWVSLNGNTSVTVTTTNTGSGGILALNGTTVLGILATGSATLNGLDGSKPLTLIFGAQQRSFEQGQVQGCAISKITAGSPAGINFLNQPAQEIGGVVVGDSISNDSGATTPQTEGWVALARAAGYGLSALGYGSAQGVYAGAQSNWATLRPWIAAGLVGITRKVIIWALGSNDALGAQGPGACSLADYLVSFKAFLNNCAADFPGIPVLVVSPIYRKDEATIDNGFGWHLQDLRDAQQAECQNRTDVYYLEGANLVDPSKLPDGAHPNTSGHLDMWNGIQPGIDNALTASPPVVAMEWGKTNNGAVVGPGIVYQRAPPTSGYGGGVNGKLAFVWPTKAGEKVVLTAPNQTINRNLGTDVGSIFAVTNQEQVDAVATARHGWYWDGAFIRCLELGNVVYERPLPGGLVSFALALYYNKVEYLINGAVAVLDTPSTIGIPAGTFWPVGLLRTPGDVQGSGSHISGATIAAKTLIASGF